MSHDDHTPTAGELLASFADCIDHADWDGLAALLAEDFHCDYVATGEAFDRDGFVAVNRDYPGRWRFERQDLVDAGQRAVLRAKVSDATGESDEVHFVATFATACSGVLAEVVEVWAEVAEAPDDRRPV